MAEMGQAAVSQPHLQLRQLVHQVRTCRTWMTPEERSHNNHELQHQFNRIYPVLTATRRVVEVGAEITHLMIQTSPQLAGYQ